MEDARTDRVGCRGGVYHTAFYTLKPYANSPLSVSVSPRSRDRDRDRDRGGVGGSLKSQHDTCLYANVDRPPPPQAQRRGRLLANEAGFSVPVVRCLCARALIPAGQLLSLGRCGASAAHRPASSRPCSWHRLPAAARPVPQPGSYSQKKPRCPGSFRPSLALHRCPASLC